LSRPDRRIAALGSAARQPAGLLDAFILFSESGIAAISGRPEGVIPNALRDHPHL
jgi:hypothetical protein